MLVKEGCPLVKNKIIVTINALYLYYQVKQIFTLSYFTFSGDPYPTNPPLFGHRGGFFYNIFITFEGCYSL